MHKWTFSRALAGRSRRKDNDNRVEKPPPWKRFFASSEGGPQRPAFPGRFVAGRQFLTDRSKTATMGSSVMARPREFDREQVLDQAIEVFWQHGYEGTSIQHLVDRMGIHRGSLYCAFGDKHGLFLAALDRYEEVFHSRILERLAEGGHRGKARRAIRRVFEDIVGSCAGSAGRRGCLMTNSAVELAAHDRDTAARVIANLSRLEEALCTALRTAQAEGELARKHDARALARFLASSLQGLRVMGISCPDRTVLRDVARVTLSVLD